MRDPGGDAATAAAPAAPLPDAERAALTGTIYASAGKENAFHVVAIDPAGKAAPRTLTPPGGSWYPTPNRAAPLAIVTTDQGEIHTEQLALLGDAPEKVKVLGTPMHFTRYPNLSADGKLVVFEADPESFRDLYRLDVPTGKITRLTTEPSGSFEPTLSPDATRVVFTSSRDGNAELYELDLATKTTKRLTDAPSDDWGAMFSPDGKAIVFLSDRETLPRLYVLTGDAAAPLHTGSAVGEEASATWSPDSTRVAYTVATQSGASEIWVATVATGEARRVSQPGARDEAPSWSPDGKHLAFVSTRDRRIDLYVVRADGSAEARLTDTPEEEWIPRWLP